MSIKLTPELKKALGIEAVAPRSKYAAVRAEYNGRTYDSKAEARYASQLDLGVKAGVVAWWIPQPLFMLGPLPYRPDFLVGETLVGDSWPNVFNVYAVDVKGVETQRFRDVRRMWAEHGPVPLRVIKNGKHTETITRGA